MWDFLNKRNFDGAAAALMGREAENFWQGVKTIVEVVPKAGRSLPFPVPPPPPRKRSLTRRAGDVRFWVAPTLMAKDSFGRLSLYNNLPVLSR